jgi:putative ABC transport system permease protein
MRDPLLTRTREQIAADNRAEIDGWIDERAAELVASGIDPAEARRRAVDEFGDVGEAQRYAVRQDVATDRRLRAALWIEEFGCDVRIAIRTLARAPIVTGVVLLTFGLGIGAVTAVFSVVHAMLLRPLPYGDEETLVQLQPVENGAIRPAARYSAAALVALRDRTTSFTGIAGIEGGNSVITENGDPEQVMVSAVTPDGFDVVRARAAIGRTFGVNEQSGTASHVVVLLNGLWRRRFGADPHIVGRTIDLDGDRCEVIGVMPPGFRVPTYEAAELLTPRDLSPLLRNANSSHVRFLRVFARLKPGVSAQAAQADVDQVMRDLQREDVRSNGGIDTRVVPIRAAVAGDARPRLLVLMGAAAFVLLIACANVAGILLSRAIARRHELSVRMALGAGRRRLIRQFLAEGAVLATCGAGLGLLAAERGIAALQQIVATALPASTMFALEPRVVLFAISAAVFAAFVSSLVPALVATRTVGSALHRDEGWASPSRANRRLRLGLVAAQLAVSVVLLIGAGLFLRTFHRLSVLDLGYATDQAVTFRLPFTRPRSNPEQDAFWASLYEQLGAIPSVAFVGGGNVPMSGQSTITGLEIEGRFVERSRLPDVRYTPASDDYFAALGIPIVRGRAFNALDRDGAPAVAVVSTGLAKQLWPGGDPIGARVRVEPTKPWAAIVGIVGDVRMGGADAPQPSIYTSQRQDHWRGGGAVVIRTEGDPDSLAAGIRQAVKSVDPTLPIVGLRTLEEFRTHTPVIAERRLQLNLMLVFGFVALAVSAIGVYGVSAYATEARRREFGIRIALGASRRGVLWLALRDGAQVAVFGALAGVPVGVVIASRLRDMLYAVTPFDPLTVGVVLGTLIVVVCAASVVPARRATLIDPARTMRTD